MIYLQLFYTYFKIGLFNFGGGYAMLSLIQHEIVEKHAWLSSSEFADIVAVSQMTPGPIGINSATYIGYSVTGNVLGSIVATVAVCLPSILIVLAVAKLFHKFRSNRHVGAAFSGLRPATVGLIAAAALLLMNKENFTDYTSFILFAVAFCLTKFAKIHPVMIIALAAGVGLIIY